MPESVIGGGGERATRLGLGDYIHDLRPRYRRLLHDQRPVQVLAALRRHIDAHGCKYAVQSPENGVCHLRRGPAAHLMPHHLAGAAPNDYNLPPAQMCRLRQLAGRLRGFLLHLLHKLWIFQ